MANVFISHTGADIGWAQQIHQWLLEDAHKVFLDSDQGDGVRAGEEWRPRLYERLRWADAVICVVTPAYLESAWCAAEIGAAQALGSEILPVRAASEPLDDQLLTTKQYVDVIRDASSARNRLRLRLSIIDGSGGRGWPDDASPYPGLRSFQLGEHRVFFGRGREIKEITERLRSPAERGEHAVLTVVGPSGCGKSSLVRAGVLPRIAGGEEWLTVPPIVPGSDPMGNLVRAIASLVRERHIDVDVASLRTNLQHSGLKAVATDLLVAAQADSQCKLLIVVDQLEELLTQTKPSDRAAFVETIEPALGGPIQALATMRPEFLDPASKDADLSKLPPRIQPLRPLAADTLREVIEQPAEVAGLSFDDGLVTRLVTDTGSGDALPLLAFTLEQLAAGVRREGQLTHQRYDQIGGVQGALRRQADAALDEACNKAGVMRAQVISALLGLVTIDAEGRPAKRRAVLDELSSAMVNEFEPFVDRRLLSTEAEGERTVVGVAHESFLVNWPPLKAEIDAQQTALRARRMVENDAADWAAGGRDAGLLEGGKLTKAIVDTGAELEPMRGSVSGQNSGLTRRFGLPRLGSRQRRLVTRVELNDTGRAFLEASMRTDRSRRRRRRGVAAGVIAILTIVASVAVVGFVQSRAAEKRAQASAQRAVAARLQNEATSLLGQNRGGDDIQAFQKLIAAYVLAPDTAMGGLVNAVVQRLTTAKIADVGDWVRSVAFSPDGHRLATASSDATVRLWNADTGQQIGAALTDHSGPVNGVAFSPDGHRLVSGGDDGKVRLWNADTGEPLGAPLPGHTLSVTAVAFSRDGHRLASASWDKTVRLWNADTGEPLGAPLTGHTAVVTSVAFSPDGHRLASAGGDGTVRLWDPDTGQQIGAPLVGHTQWVTGVAFSPDGHRLASAGGDGRVRLWDPDTAQQIGAPLTGHFGTVYGVAFSPDGHRLASAGDDTTVRLWNADTGQPLGLPLLGHNGGVRAVAFSPDGRLASSSADRTVRLWNVDRVLILTGHTGQVDSVAFSLDGQLLASGSADTTVRVWDAQTGQQIGAPLTGHTGEVHAVAFSPSKRHHLASAGQDGTVRLWDAQTGQQIGPPLVGHTGVVYSVAVSSKGPRLASGGEDQTTRIWNADRNLTIKETSYPGAVASVAFSPDGQRLASGGTSSMVWLLNADTGQPIRDPLTGHIGAVYGVAFSPDGHRLASAGDDGTVRLWNADTGQQIGAALTGHSGPVNGVAFSPDGHRLASAGSDGTVLLWNADTGQPLGAPLWGHGGPVNGVAFSPDGHRLVSASSDGTVRIWPVIENATPQMLCDKLTTNMSHKQWQEWISTDPSIGYRELCPGLPTAPD